MVTGNFRALTEQQGVKEEIQDGQGLIVGNAVKTATGNLLLSPAGTNITVDAGKVLGTTGTGNINLPNNVNSQFQIEGTDVHNTPGVGQVTAPNLDTLTAGPFSNADLLHTHNNLQDNSGLGEFGDGSDGDVTLPIGKTTSLLADTYYDNLNVPAGATLNTNGFRIYCKTLCQIDVGGIIMCNGTDGQAGNIAFNEGQGGGKNGTLGGGSDGGQGFFSSIPGQIGDPAANALGAPGGVGGTGAGGANLGGPGGLLSPPNVRFGSPRNVPTAVTGEVRGAGGSAFIRGGTGGGGGGGPNGGGGGGGAGVVLISAKKIVNNGSIQANGGNGGAGTGNGGGGAGGGGGTLLLTYGPLGPFSGYSGSGTNFTNGGAGGAGSGTGAPGGAGLSGGTIVELIN
jgi:hypothetical protein